MELTTWTVPWRPNMVSWVRLRWLLLPISSFRDLAQNLTTTVSTLLTLRYFEYPFSMPHVPSVFSLSHSVNLHAAARRVRWFRRAEASWAKRLRGKQSGDWTRPSAHDRSRVVPTHEGARGEFRRRWIPVFERRYCMYMLFFPWEQGFRSTSTNEDLTRAKSLVNGKQRFGMNQVSNFAELILQSLPFFSEVCFARNVQIAEVDHAIWFVHVQEVFTWWKLLTLWRLVLIVIYVTIFAFYMHVEFSIWYGCSLFLLLCFSYLLISISHTVM